MLHYKPAWAVAASVVFVPVYGWVAGEAQILWLSPLWAGMMVMGVRDIRLNTELTDGAIVLRRPGRETRFGRQYIASVTMDLVGNSRGKRLVSRVRTTDGREINVVPSGVDQFEAYRAVRAWHRS